MKRIGYLYEQMADWDNLVEAEKVSTKRKNKNYGVKLHIPKRISNLVEIQEMILNGKMKTDEYIHEQRISGQGKLRDIAKLVFHPNHIEHQSLVLVADERVNKHLIRHTYASRTGYGQTKGALQVRDWLRKDEDGTNWFGQGDVCKYYDSIPHIVIRNGLERIFKDKRFVDSFMEPFERFSDNGKSIPLGIRPSQVAGNIALASFDRYIKEVLRVKYYIRYLDDFVVLCETKGKAKRAMKQANVFLEALGFRMHEPKVHCIERGLDFLGYVFYPDGNMYWRKSNKVNYLRRRSNVSNPKRLRELDAAAKGMLMHGNKQCKKLFKMTTGIDLSKLGIKKADRLDANGKKIIEVPAITTSVILGKEIEVKEWVKNVKTSHGDGRWVLRIEFYGSEHKLIINAAPVKAFIEGLEKAGVTRFMTIIRDKGNMHYDCDETQTKILEIHGRAIEEKDGSVVYSDTKELVTINQEEEA